MPLAVLKVASLKWLPALLSYIVSMPFILKICSKARVLFSTVASKVFLVLLSLSPRDK